MTRSHCQRFRRLNGSRRELLQAAACGFGSVAASFLMNQSLAGNETEKSRNQELGSKPTHFPPKAMSVIFLYMDGGVSQVDSFDPKPRLNEEHGKPFPED